MLKNKDFYYLLHRMILNKKNPYIIFKMTKNNAKSTLKKISIENLFFLLHFENNSKKTQRFERDIDSSFIQLHFCIKGSAKILI